MLLSIRFPALACAWQAHPQHHDRRKLIATSIAAVGAGRLPATVDAFPPPFGDPTLLVPLLQCRAALAEQASARASPVALQRLLNAPPFTSSKGGAVGSQFRAAAEAYDASLRYTAEIDESDRAFCYVSKAVKVDAQCLQRLYTSDRTFRALLRNDVLTGLQEIEGEAAFLARCANQARRLLGVCERARKVHE